MSHPAQKIEPVTTTIPQRRRLLDRARAALVEVQMDATAAGLDRLTPEEIAVEARAARVLASMRSIDRDFLLGRATFEEIMANLPTGVPTALATAYVNELRELVELGMTIEEAEAATRQVAFSGSAEQVTRWLQSEESACGSSK